MWQKGGNRMNPGSLRKTVTGVNESSQRIYRLDYEGVIRNWASHRKPFLFLVRLYVGYSAMNSLTATIVTDLISKSYSVLSHVAGKVTGM
jgi:hypothetical protein